MNGPLLSLRLQYEHDVVAARQRARQIAGLAGFDVQDQTRIATAVSEIARNAVCYAGGGKVEFVVEGKTAPQVLLVRVSDRGPGIGDLPGILAGRYRSQTGMGVGVAGARRLMDQFQVDSGESGTTVWLRKIFPPSAPLLAAERLRAVLDQLSIHRPQSLLEELQQQNQELLRALEELRARQEDLTRLNQELEDTNRGVAALYAELDEKADHLRRADEMKSRFLSNMSHEFRTPLNSIRALSRLLLDHSDGSLTPDQTTQVQFIKKAAEDLSELVNDLLDLAKVQAGKIVVRPAEFEAANLFGALRGMLRPLLVNEHLSLVFDDVTHIPPLFTDEGKVSQILRNLISNALKFTEHGEVRVAAAPGPGDAEVTFTVTDTGIGIAAVDQVRIFEEFGQVENPVQRRVRGTGLGLPLTKKLAELLGGRVHLTSTPGLGSSFAVTIPRVYAEPTEPREPFSPPRRPPTGVPILVVEDSAEDLFLYDKLLKGSGFSMIPARTVREARQAIDEVQPAAVVLNTRLRGEDTWSLLADLKSTERTKGVPILVVTSVEDQHKGLGLGADAYALKPLERQWLLGTLRRLSGQEWPRRLLVIDDDEISRYLVRGLLPEDRYVLSEAPSGSDGLRLARETRPAAILLDLVMPGMSGLEVLDQLRGDPATREIPVIVITSKVLEHEERQRITGSVVAVLSKDAPSREDAARGILAALIAAGVG